MGSSVPETTTTASIAAMNFNLPAVAQWVPFEGREQHLGLKEDEHHCSLTCSLSVDETRNTFSCKLRISVKTKGPVLRTYMYMPLEPSEMLSLDPHIHPVPGDVVNSFISAKHCSSVDQICGVRFLLAAPAVVVGPEAVVEPKSLPVKQAIARFFSLGQTSCMTIYFPSTAIRDTLPQLTAARGSGLVVGAFVMSTLYGGQGGRPIYHLQDIFGHDESTASDVPPAYHQVIPTPPPALCPSKRQKDLSPTPETEQSLPKKKPRKGLEMSTSTAIKQPGQPLVGLDDVWKRTMTEQLAFLTAQVASIQSGNNPHPRDMVDAGVQTDDLCLGNPPELQSKHPASPHPSTCSTVEDTIEDRLVIIERTMSRLGGEVERLRNSLDPKLAPPNGSIVERTSEELQPGIADCLNALEYIGEEVTEIRTRVSDEMHDIADDMVTGLKLDMREFVSDEMKEVEDNVLQRVKDAIAKTTFSIDFDHVDE